MLFVILTLSTIGDVISEFTEDGTIDQSNSNYTANDYAKAINDYFRSNLLKKILNDTTTLSSISFFNDQLLLSCRFQNKKCAKSDFFFYYDFYYAEDLKYTVVDESPAITIVSLLGALGGNLGLFLGKNNFSFLFSYMFKFNFHI